MKKNLVVLVCMFFIGTTALFAQQKYIGAAKCKMCHSSKGNQYKQWSESKHAKAYSLLLTEEAKTIAKAKGIEDPSKDEKCLKCHSTASAIAANLKETITVEEGVSCETCHGPGSVYKSMTIMKSREASIKNGLIIPDEKVCITCHNAESPTFKSFDFASASAKIAHPNPKP